jgi:hypothetical protein
MEATRSAETSVYIKRTRCHIPEEGILHSHRRENLNPAMDELSLSKSKSKASL